MTEQQKNDAASRLSADSANQSQGWLAPVFLRKRTFSTALVASLFAIIYWSLVASDRYVSEAHVVIQRTDVAAAQMLDFGSLLTGVTGQGNRVDQMLLRDHLLSVDMLQKLDAALDLRSHYSDPQRDILSRMWDKDEELELFHEHYLSRVTVDYDDQAGVLVVQAQAYDPKTAHAITSLLVKEGGRYMNQLAQRLLKDQVAFLDEQVTQRAAEFSKARQAMIAFQNEHGLVSPQGTVENLAGVVNTLEGRLSELETRRKSLLGYLTASAPAVVEIDLQIKAVKEQIDAEKKRLASSSGDPLNVALEQYGELQLAAELAQDVYKTALVSLETGRVEATRTLKKVSILQAPTMPQYPLEPRRIYNIIVFILVALILAGVIHLLAAIIRDHRD